MLVELAVGGVQCGIALVRADVGRGIRRNVIFIPAKQSDVVMIVGLENVGSCYVLVASLFLMLQCEVIYNRSTLTSYKVCTLMKLKIKTKRARTRIKTSGNSEMEYIVSIHKHEYFMLRDKIRCFLIQTPMFPQHPSLIQQIAPRCQHL